MNFTVCGNPLIYVRAVFHCSCGVLVHSYCWDQHVLQAHRPSFEIGSVNLDGEFMVRESRKQEQVSIVQAATEQSPQEQDTPLLE